MKTDEHDVSIIIVNWNTRNLLRNCLELIYQKSGEVDYEIIVVDNGSTDGTAQMVKTEFPEAKLIANSQNKGFAAANNQGITIAKGRYILLLNSDTVILDNAIAKTISFADAHPEAAVVGCRVLNPDRSLQLTCFMFPSILNMVLSSSYLYKLFPKSKFFGRERMTWWNRDDVREVDVVTGCFMLVRRNVIEQVGMMDERFFMYGEETDWCYRFKKTGHKILFTPDAQVVHFGGQSSKQAAHIMALQLRGSILQFIHKHRSFLEYKLACILIWLFFVVRIPIWFAKFVLDRRNRSYSRTCIRSYITGIINLTTKGAQGLCVKSSNSRTEV